MINSKGSGKNTERLIYLNAKLMKIRLAVADFVLFLSPVKIYAKKTQYRKMYDIFKK